MIILCVNGDIGEGGRHRTDRAETERLEMIDRSVGSATWSFGYSLKDRRFIRIYSGISNSGGGGCGVGAF